MLEYSGLPCPRNQTQFPLILTINPSFLKSLETWDFLDVGVFLSPMSEKSNAISSHSYRKYQFLEILRVMRFPRCWSILVSHVWDQTRFPLILTVNPRFFEILRDMRFPRCWSILVSHVREIKHQFPLILTVNPSFLKSLETWDFLDAGVFLSPMSEKSNAIFLSSSILFSTAVIWSNIEALVMNDHSRIKDKVFNLFYIIARQYRYMMHCTVIECTLKKSWGFEFWHIHGTIYENHLKE